MAGAGWSNPFPLEMGGGVTNTERIYRAMRAAVGTGGSALDDENTIEGVWRQARASGLAAAAASGERALINAFPGHATDLLPYYEEILAIVPEDESDLVARREEAVLRWTSDVESDVPAVLAHLQRFDARFAILEPGHTEAHETVLGRMFEDYAGALPFHGGRKSTLFGNFSTEFVLYVLFDLGSGVSPGPIETSVMGRAAEYLNDALSAWVDFQITTADGFILDESLLDITGL